MISFHEGWALAGAAALLGLAAAFLAGALVVDLGLPLPLPLAEAGLAAEADLTGAAADMVVAGKLGGYVVRTRTLRWCPYIGA